MNRKPHQHERGIPAKHLPLWLALIPALSLPFVASLFYFVLFSEHLFARVMYGAAKLFMLIWPLVALHFLAREPICWAGLWPARSWRFLGFGLATGAVIMALMWGLERGPLGQLLQESAPAIRVKAAALGVLDHYWAFGLFLALFHSFLEEYYWRWFVFGWLRRVVPRGLAHLVAGACFAAHHVVIATQYFPWGWGWLLGGLTGMGGILWSWMYERQNSLAGPWLSHVLADLGILAVGHQVVFGSWW
jgi:membrane protease YdiL (CAAX protease family)